MKWWLCLGAFGSLLLLAAPGYACIPIDLVCRADGAVDDWISAKTAAATSGAAQGAVDAIKPEIDEVLSQQLPALIGQMNSAVESRIISAQQAGDELVTRIQTALDASFSKASDFKNEFFQQLGSFRDDLFKELNKTLDSTFLNVHCTAVDVKQFPTEMQDLFERVSKKFSLFQRNTAESNCRSEYVIPSNISPSDVQHPLEAYKLSYCMAVSSYTIDMPASTLAAAYGDLQQRATDLMCVVRYTGEATRSIALQYFIDTGRATQVWNDASKL